MRNRNIIVLAVCVVLAAIGVLTFWTQPKGPKYAGKTLRAWLEIYDRDPGEPSQLEAAAAVRQIGTNAIPYLLTWLQYREPRWKQRIRRVADAASPKMQDEIGAVIDMNRFHGADVSALLGFKILGHEAEAAIPELHRLTQDTNHPAISVRAAQCLIYVSGEKEALAASSQLLTTPNAIIRRMTTNALATIAPGIFQTNDVLTNRTRKF